MLVALSAVVFALLRAGIQSSFFRFYFQAEDERGRQTVVRTSFWFTLGTATLALAVGLALAEPISTAIFGTSENANLVRAAFVGLWASMNYDQLTALFRVEERSVSYSIASLANVLLTVGATILLVVVLDKGPDRRARRQLQRDARGLARPPRLPARRSSGSSSTRTSSGA